MSSMVPQNRHRIGDWQVLGKHRKRKQKEKQPVEKRNTGKEH